MPVIGFLAPVSQNEELLRDSERASTSRLYRGGERIDLVPFCGNEINRLPALADDLARRRVAVIATVGHAAAFAVKVATAMIPILFVVAGDPVRLGLVASLARPGGNLTGMNFFATELVAKRLAPLRDLVPAAARVAVLVDPASKTVAEPTLQEVESAARAMGLQIQVLNASNGREIGAAFAAFERERPDALFVSIGPFFTARRVQLATLAARHMIPMTSGNRQITETGGLMSYGANITDAFRQVGVYAGRISRARNLPTCRWFRRQIRASYQRRNSPYSRPYSAAVAAFHRRRGDRMSTARVHHVARRRGRLPLAARAQQPAMPAIGFLPQRRRPRHSLTAYAHSTGA